jgi:hypothetical protein
MRGPNLDLKSRISAKISGGAVGAVWTPSDFADLGPRDAVDKSIQRMVTAGKLRRIDRGLYDQPRINQLTRKPAAADYRRVIDAIARRDQTRMLVDGMTAANDLGLSDAVPGRVIVHTDARHTPLRLGNLVITFRPTSASKLHWASRPAMRIVQALHWLKPKLENLEDNQRIKKRLASLLSDAEQGTALREDLSAGLASLPAWMQNFLRDLVPLKSATPSKPATSKPLGKRRKAPVV